jgi:toxin ParE1/3/4
MTPRVVWSPDAREDLFEIYETICLDNPAAAERLVSGIERKVERLAAQPRLGPRRPEIRPATRQLVERPYLIFYENHPDTDDGPIDTISIVRIIHGHRDLTHLD